MIEKFEEIVKDRHAYARKWKERTGGKAFGYFCCYMPEEIVHAAGVLPVRIVDSHEPEDFTDPYYQTWSRNCPFSRGCFAEALKGAYDYLDGLVMSRSCLHVLHAYDAWNARMPVSFSHFVFAPAMMNVRGAQEHFVGELADFRAAIEKWSGASITDEALTKSIAVYDENRRLQRQLYELRKSGTPPISGAETLDVVLAGMFCDKAEHNAMLRELLDRLPSRQDKPQPGSRIMMIGGEVDQSELLRLIESRGATIITDDLCMGTRYFWNSSEPLADPLSTIAARYIAKPSCPVKDVNDRRRMPHIMQLVRDFDVEGVILVQQKLCDPHEFDFPLIQKHLKEANIPYLHIELETTTPIGQITTRVEAFIEVLELDLV